MPTLVIHRLSDRITPPFHGRYLASRIAGARYFEQPGDHSLRFAGGGDSDALFGEIAGFLATLLGLATGPQAAEGAEARAAPDPVPAGGDRSAAAAGARPVRRFAHNLAGYDTVEGRKGHGSVTLPLPGLRADSNGSSVQDRSQCPGGQ